MQINEYFCIEKMGAFLSQFLSLSRDRNQDIYFAINTAFSYNLTFESQRKSLTFFSARLVPGSAGQTHRICPYLDGLQLPG